MMERPSRPHGPADEFAVGTQLRELRRTLAGTLYSTLYGQDKHCKTKVLDD